MAFGHVWPPPHQAPVAEIAILPPRGRSLDLLDEPAIPRPCIGLGRSPLAAGADGIGADRGAARPADRPGDRADAAAEGPAASASAATAFAISTSCSAR